jgi:hypothetical protein
MEVIHIKNMWIQKKIIHIYERSFIYNWWYKTKFKCNQHNFTKGMENLKQQSSIGHYA